MDFPGDSRFPPSGENVNSAQPTNGKGRSDPESSATDAVRELREHLALLVEYLRTYLHAKWDSYRLGVRRALLYAGFGLAVSILALAAATVGMAMFLAGLSDGLAGLVGRPWVADLLVGGAVLLVLTATVRLGWVRYRRKALEGAVRRYESVRDG